MAVCTAAFMTWASHQQDGWKLEGDTSWCMQVRGRSRQIYRRRQGQEWHPGIHLPPSHVPLPHLSLPRKAQSQLQKQKASHGHDSGAGVANNSAKSYDVCRNHPHQTFTSRIPIYNLCKKAKVLTLKFLSIHIRFITIPHVASMTDAESCVPCHCYPRLHWYEPRAIAGKILYGHHNDRSECNVPIRAIQGCVGITKGNCWQKGVRSS
jgi:hypothetical protein